MIRRIFQLFLFVYWVFIWDDVVLIPYVFLGRTGCFLFFSRSWSFIEIIFVCWGFIFLCLVFLVGLGILRFAFGRLRSISGGIFFRIQLYVFFGVIIMLVIWNVSNRLPLRLTEFRASLFWRRECITRVWTLLECHWFLRGQFYGVCDQTQGL